MHHITFCSVTISTILQIEFDFKPFLIFYEMKPRSWALMASFNAIMSQGRHNTQRNAKPSRASEI